MIYLNVLKLLIGYNFVRDSITLKIQYCENNVINYINLFNNLCFLLNVYIYVYMYIYTHIYIHVCICVYIYIHTYLYIYIYIYMYIYIYI